MLFIFYIKIRSKMMFGDIRNTKVFPGYIIDRSAKFSVNNCLLHEYREKKKKKNLLISIAHVKNLQLLSKKQVSYRLST